VNVAVLPRVSRALPWFALALGVILLDQWTKGLAHTHLEYGRPLALLPWFDLTLHYNTGAAFSFLSDAGGWQRYLLSGIAVLVSVVLVVWLCRVDGSQRLLGLGLALILGGALGNLWDRIAHGHVVDFISLHYAGYYFPAFNLADSAITAGAAAMVLDSLLVWIRHRRGAGGA